MGLHSMSNVTCWKYLSVKARGVTIGTACAAILLSQLAILPNFPAHAQDGSFDDFPFRVPCEVGGTHHAFYLSKIDPDGVAVYMTPDRRAGTVTIDGKAQPVGGNGPGSCSSKTLEQLRSTGQTYYLKR